MAEHEQCRSCGAPIRWAQTASGKPMPLNAAADPQGLFALVDAEDPREVPRAVSGRRLPPGERWTSHFATCPQADSWRKS